MKDKKQNNIMSPDNGTCNHMTVIPRIVPSITTCEYYFKRMVRIVSKEEKKEIKLAQKKLLTRIELIKSLEAK
jgi:hypothetical protein